MKQEWIYINELGRGGNGIVWKVKNAKGDFYALKELHSITNSRAYQRFRDEIEVLKRIGKAKGVIEIIDSYIPVKPTPTDKPYYVMPLGYRIWDFIKEKDPVLVYKLGLKICEAVRFLHDNNITHRDIKPANILIVNSEPVLSDFGLVDFPDKKDNSLQNEQIGPKWTIAPEMKRISSSSEFKKADVYSLAKTLWILFTNQKWGFDGQYIPNSSISLDKYIDIKINTMTMGGVWNCHSIVLLEQLMMDSTSNDVSKRPSITEFIERFINWFESNDDFRERNPMEWEYALSRIFPISIPDSCSWTNLDDIFKILSILTQFDNLNHTFLPDFGGDDIEKVEYAHEEGCLLLNDTYIVCPETLYFECIEKYDWTYFRLEAKHIKSLSENEYFDSVYINENQEYVQYSEDLPEYSRYKEGCFVFVFKTSELNHLKGELDGYTGNHSKMESNIYRKRLERENKNRLLTLCSPC